MFETPARILTAYALFTSRFAIFDQLIDNAWAVIILRTGGFFFKH